MMKKAIIVASVIFISICVAGCSNPPSPPGSEIPKVVVDYVPSYEYENVDENYTVIYIHGLDEIRYDNITIQINNKTVLRRNHSYSAEHSTNLTEFDLNIDVYYNEDYFNFNATFRISEKKNIMYEITYPDLDTKEVKTEDLPYSEKLDQIEVE